MGIYDRDYYRNSPRPSLVGTMNAWSVTTWLIAINVAVFLLDSILARQGIGYQQLIGYDPYGNPVFGITTGPLDHWGYFSVVTAVLQGQVWRFLTFQFLHASVNHILFNMISLYFFGQLVESYLGSRRYLAFYLLCGVAGPVMYMALWALHLLKDGPATPLVGASAGIFGILIAAAVVAPSAIVLVMGVIPVQLKTLAWVLLGIAVYTVLTSGNNAGGQAAHLGGAAVGFWLIRDPRLINWIDRLAGPKRSRMSFRR